MNIISRKKNQVSTKQLDNQDEIAILSNDENMCLLITNKLIEEDTLLREEKPKLKLQVFVKTKSGYIQTYNINLTGIEEIKQTVRGFPIEEVKTWRFT